MQEYQHEKIELTNSQWKENKLTLSAIIPSHVRLHVHHLLNEENVAEGRAISQARIKLLSGCCRLHALPGTSIVA